MANCSMHCYKFETSLNDSELSFSSPLINLVCWVCSAVFWIAAELIVWTVRLTLGLPLLCRTPQWADISDQRQAGEAGPAAGAAAVPALPGPPPPVCRGRGLRPERAGEAHQGGAGRARAGAAYRERGGWLGVALGPLQQPAEQPL